MSYCRPPHKKYSTKQLPTAQKATLVPWNDYISYCAVSFVCANTTTSRVYLIARLRTRVFVQRLCLSPCCHERTFSTSDLSVHNQNKRELHSTSYSKAPGVEWSGELRLSCHDLRGFLTPSKCVVAGIRSQASSRWICDKVLLRQVVALSTSVCPCQCLSSISGYSHFIHLPSTLHKHSNRQRP